jgi:hypothetical protein
MTTLPTSTQDVGASTSHNPKGLHRLFQGYLYHILSFCIEVRAVRALEVQFCLRAARKLHNSQMGRMLSLELLDYPIPELSRVFRNILEHLWNMNYNDIYELKDVPRFESSNFGVRSLTAENLLPMFPAWLEHFVFIITPSVSYMVDQFLLCLPLYAGKAFQEVWSRQFSINDVSQNEQCTSTCRETNFPWRNTVKSVPIFIWRVRTRYFLVKII